MAYVPGCRYDLFISYASENNRDGWVENFTTRLVDELEQLLEGRQFSADSVFRDKTALRLGQAFPPALETAAGSSAVLIPFLSPSYLSSDWCERERMAFFRILPEGTEPAERLAPIRVRPVDEGLLMRLYRDAEYGSMMQPETQETWPTGSPEWVCGVRKIAAQLADQLRRLRRKYKPVFVGRALPGFEYLRETCLSELQKNHFRFSPESLQILDDVQACERILQQAALSVHFIGGASDTEMKIADLAAQVCPGPTVLYTPFQASITAEEELWLAEFERTLGAKAGSYRRIERKNDQELLSVLEQEITRVRPPAPAQPHNAELALVCDDADLDLARQLRNEIQRRERFAVAYPDFLENKLLPSENTRAFQKLLKGSRAFLFCWGKTCDPSHLELISHISLKLNETAPLRWYLVEPNVDEKRKKHPDAICQPGEFDYELLTPFLAPLRS